MRCTSPRTVGFLPDGKTLSWSSKTYSKEFATFKLPCGKCIECRLDYARQWAIRCVHEAQMHPKNSFITLTYADQHLTDPKLNYEDFQKFMRKLRKTQNEPIGFFVTGEYGEQTKRKHWHAILFNYEPNDSTYKYTAHSGHKVYDSPTLTKIWGYGITEFGSVTFDSAGYCARYAAKKLGHGHDGEHEFEPISKKSSKHAIGKKWLEKYWPDVFLHGRTILSDGTQTSVPRYYEKWFKQHHPEHWHHYVTQTKRKIIEEASAKSEAEQKEWVMDLIKRNYRKSKPMTRDEVRALITKQKFKMLQDYLKL